MPNDETASGAAIFRQTDPEAPGRGARSARARVSRRAIAAALILLGGTALTPARDLLAGTASTAIEALRDRLAADPLVPRPDQIRGVRVAEVSIRGGLEERAFTGSVAARYESNVAFRVGGKVIARQAEIGQSVRAGDLLFVLDPSDYKATLAAAEAALAAARAEEVQAASDERRQRQLLGQGWTTQAAYERLEAAARATANQSKAAAEQVALARNALRYTELRAQHDGVVTALRAEAGQVVTAGQPILTMVRPGEREAVVSIPEGQIAGIEGWRATASFWGAPSSPEAAALREVAPQADPASRTYVARFSLSESAANAPLGATVTIHLSRRSPIEVARIPGSAIFFLDGVPHVWRLSPDGGAVARVPVSIAVLGPETADVAGLSPGDRVVTIGVHRLHENDRVRVAETAKRAPERDAPAPQRGS